MADLLLKRTLAGFAAGDEASANLMRKYEIGQTYKATVRKPRIGVDHRRYWKLLSVVCENSEQFESVELLHEYVKLRTGHCSPILIKSTGEIVLVPRSISFTAMDQVQFEDFWQRVVKLVCTEVLPGLSEDELQLEVMRLVGIAA